MAGKPTNREDMLLKVKEAEKQAIKTEHDAKQKASLIMEKARKESSKIVDSSEETGRKEMRERVDAARKEMDISRKQKLDEAVQKGEEMKSRARDTYPEVIEWISNQFKKEYDVKN